MIIFMYTLEKTIIFGMAILLALVGCDENKVVTDITQFPRIKILDTEAKEEDRQAKIPVQLSWPYTTEITVQYEVGASDIDSLPVAEGGNDFVARSGQLTFSPGDTINYIDVDLVDDRLEEGKEYFLTSLVSSDLGVIIKGTGVVGIISGDEEFTVDPSGPDSPLNYTGYDLVWAEEFDGQTIDANSWTHEIGGNGWGNNELQYYTDNSDNSFQSGGYLVIEAKKEKIDQNDYTSARLVSAGKREFQYGRIDIRAKCPSGRGIWPALWMLGSDFYSSGWPSCGEIDIMELIGNQPGIIHGTAHYGENPAQHQYMGGQSYLVGETYADKFHVFSLKWKENSIEWLVDGKSFFTLTPDKIGDHPWPFNNPFFFIMNVAVGGNWPGSPDESTAFPQQLVVDYIRVFQTKDS